MSLRNPPKVFVRNPSKYNADTHDPELRARLDDALLRRGKIEESVPLNYAKIPPPRLSQP